MVFVDKKSKSLRDEPRFDCVPLEKLSKKWKTAEGK